MDLSKVKRSSGPLRKAKRVGRGHATGQGKTSGRGQKGQRARGPIKRGFEGGQNPLYQKMPKLRGTSNKAHNIGIFRAEYSVLNIAQLEILPEGTEITPEGVMAMGLIKKMGKKGLKILGEGDLTHPVTVRAHAVSASAREKIEKAGGTVEVIEG